MNLTDTMTVATSGCPRVDAPTMSSDGTRLPVAVRGYAFVAGKNRHHAVAANADLPTLAPSAQNVWTITSVKSAPPPRGAIR